MVLPARAKSVSGCALEYTAVEMSGICASSTTIRWARVRLCEEPSIATAAEAMASSRWRCMHAKRPPPMDAVPASALFSTSVDNVRGAEGCGDGLRVCGDGGGDRRAAPTLEGGLVNDALLACRVDGAGDCGGLECCM
jgi:hypothetical protein